MTVARRLLALAVLAAAVTGCGGDGAASEEAGAYAQEGAPFRFSYPSGFTKQAEDTGQEVQGREPVHKVAVGRDATNVVVVAAYTLKKPVEEFAASDFAAVVDRAAKGLALARGAKIAKRATGKLGSLPSTVYDLSATPEGVEQRLVYAFRGKSQFFIRCQWDDASREAVTAGCDEVQRTFQPT